MDTSLRKLYPWFTLLGLLIGGLVIAAFYKDQHREWKDWQRQYIKDEIGPRRHARAAGGCRAHPGGSSPDRFAGTGPRRPLHQLPCCR